MDYRNLELIVKRAVEYVETIKSEDLEVIGLGFKEYHPMRPGQSQSHSRGAERERRPTGTCHLKPTGTNSPSPASFLLSPN